MEGGGQSRDGSGQRYGQHKHCERGVAPAHRCTPSPLDRRRGIAGICCWQRSRMFESLTERGPSFARCRSAWMKWYLHHPSRVSNADATIGLAFDRSFGFGKIVTFVVARRTWWLAQTLSPAATTKVTDLSETKRSIERESNSLPSDTDATGIDVDTLHPPETTPVTEACRAHVND